MKKSLMNKTKKGAASFYMVAFSTLILIIIVTSFAAVIISEVTRTANDDLSQSAYDSALAGVEDAKLVAYNYQKCVSEESAESNAWCEQIVSSVKADNAECDMVGSILGRQVEADGGVLIQESSTSANNMAQAYTCVKVSLASDIVSSLNSSNPMRVIKTKFEDGVAEKVRRVNIHWFSDSNANNDQQNYGDFNGNNVAFTDNSKTAIPPTISISMLQTAVEFELNDFTEVGDNETDRGTLYLVPTDKEEIASGSNETYVASYSDGVNHIGASGFVESNNEKAKNLPYAVYCQSDGDYVCSAAIDIPDPIGGTRNPDTFIFVVSLPNGAPATDFSLDFECATGDVCYRYTVVNEDGTEEEVESNMAKLDGVQIKIDSTGRANDMYRRVEVRLEGESEYPLSLMGPLELLGENQNEMLFEKNYAVISEYDF